MFCEKHVGGVDEKESEEKGMNELIVSFKNDVIEDESGIGVIEVILILLVLVGLVIIFKGQIVSLAKNIFSNITGQVDSLS